MLTHCFLQSRYALADEILARVHSCTWFHGEDHRKDRRPRVGNREQRHSLEVVGAHVSVAAVAVQALQAPGGGLLARVEVLPGKFTARRVS